MNRDDPLAVLRRRTRLGMPGMLFAVLFGGLASYHVLYPDVPEPFSLLSSPYAVALMALAAAGCAALVVRAARAKGLLLALEARQAREIRRELLASARGEEFARRWSARPIVGNRVRELREKRDISPAELAEVLGVHERALSLIERGRYEPSLLLALFVSEYLGESVGEVFRVVEAPPPPPRPSLPDTEAERR